MDLLTVLATNDEEGASYFSKLPLRSNFRNDNKRSESIEQYRASKGKHNLTTKARQKVVGRNKQIVERAG